jgi:hypothetical protein
MRFLAALCALALCASADDRALERAVEKVDRQTAGKLLKIGQRALQTNQGATANRIFKRVLQLHPDRADAMKALGFKKEKGDWVRSLAAQSKIDTRRDRNPEFVTDIRRTVYRVEVRRARAIVEAVEEAGSPSSARATLLPLLDRTPRLVEVHEALGHERMGANFVRPEFKRMARRLPKEVRAWANCRTTDLKPSLTGEHLTVSGTYPLHKVGYRRVAATFSNDEAVKAALMTEAPHQLVRFLFGEYAEGWKPQRVYFLTPDRYRALLARHISDPERLKRRLRWRTYYHTRFVAMRADDADDAADGYAHSVGFMTMDRWASPKDESVGPKSEYSWLNEGFGYFLSLELFDSAETWFATENESLAKAAPMKLTKNKANCLAYVREQMLHGVHYPLREVFGRTLNNLDLLASLEAWTFVRFLILYDSEGFRTFTGELRRQTKGPLPDRVDTALRDAFDKGTESLEPLWRAFTLEIH